MLKISFKNTYKNINPPGFCSNDLRYEHDPNYLSFISVLFVLFCFFIQGLRVRSLGEKPWVFSAEGPFLSETYNVTVGHLPSRHEVSFSRLFSKEHFWWRSW